MSVSLFGIGGDALSAPEDTLVSCWAALGAGADGLVLRVKLSGQNNVVCTADDTAKADAGKSFRSVVLGKDNQPTGKYGKDRPWSGNGKRRPLYYPQLDEVLLLFSRRTKIIIMPAEGETPARSKRLLDSIAAVLKKYGLSDKVTMICHVSMIKQAAGSIKGAEIYAYPDNNAVMDCVEAASKAKIKGVLLDAETLIDGRKIKNDFSEVWNNSSLDLMITSSTMPYALSSSTYKLVSRLRGLQGLLARSIEHSRGLTGKPAMILEDAFAGTKINRAFWSAGYSHVNTETQISQNNGIIIDIQEGQSYSGAAAVCVIPVHGAFDAQVEFEVSNPHQGTTFELAAIGVEPGYHRTDNRGLNSKSVSLTFDVHGCPPYASAEQDEDDGFRAGWNNGYSIARIDDNWDASSVNMYNKYTRDVGNRGGKKGHLRLVRNGAIFNTYYKDKFNPAWVCSGSVLVPNLGSDVYIRLAAKHWNKVKPAPANRIKFKNFKLYQP